MVIPLQQMHASLWIKIGHQLPKQEAKLRTVLHIHAPLRVLCRNVLPVLSARAIEASSMCWKFYISHNDGCL